MNDILKFPGKSICEKCIYQSEEVLSIGEFRRIGVENLDWPEDMPIDLCLFHALGRQRVKCKLSIVHNALVIDVTPKAKRFDEADRELPLAKLARKYGIDKKLLWQRININGWDLSLAVRC